METVKQKTKENMSKEYLLSSVKNALRILRSFSIEEPEKGITELAESLRLSKSTVSRLMSTLASEDFVYKDPKSKKYRLGISVLALSGIITSSMDIYKEAQPFLQKLVDQLGETVHLTFLEGAEVVYLHKVESNHPIHLQSHVGKRNPAYCTSSGKAILAFQNREIVERVIANGLKRYTKKTITDPDAFRACLQQVREAGYAYSIEEFMEGVASVGAPIRDSTGQVIAAVTITGPIQRIQPYKIPFYAKKLISICKEISEQLGYYGH